MNWYNQKPDEIENKLDTNKQTGLTTSKAQTLLQEHGPNALKEAEKRDLEKN